jgi:hypothetical protein
MSDQQTSESTGATETAAESTDADTGAVTEALATDANVAAAKTAEGEQATEAAKPEFVYSDWAKGLADEKRRDYAQRFKSIDDVLNGAMKLREEISSRIKLPGKDAKPEDIAAFRKQIGVPDTADGYEVKAPEGYNLDGPVGLVVDMSRDLAHKNHIPAGAFQDFADGMIKIDQEIQQQVNESVKKWRSDKEQEIRKEFGGDFEANLNAGKRARDVFGGEELTEFFNTQVTINGVSMTPGDHPAMIKFMATLGKRMGEDGVIGMTSESERQSTKERIDEIYAKTPPGTAGYAAPAVQKELQALFEKLEGNGAVVGSGGRTY